MKSKIFKKQKLVFKIFVFLLFVFIGTLSYTFSEVTSLKNGDRVAEGSEVTYYLTVKYDGIDRKGVDSTTIAKDEELPDVSSGVINITDNLPAGLTFVDFIAPASGDNIGSVRQDDATKVCLGGVSYTDLKNTNSASIVNSTGKISFKIDSMQAGCQLTIGLKTTVDDLPSGETRRDYYNSFTAQEGEQTVVSNTVHLWAGKDGVTMYPVKYQYTGTVPANAPSVPKPSDGSDSFGYVPGATVKVADDVHLDNYIFSGWKTSNVTVASDGTFTMPTSSVTFTGSFTEKAKYNVVYQIDGVTPDDYIVPSTKTYYIDNLVTLDTLEVGTEINGYRFLGWTLPSGVTLDSNGQFTMPNKQVTITGKFEEIKYNVSYKFQGELPPNYEQYIPATHQVAPGKTVTLQPEPSDVTNYEFVGWLKEDGFIMPEEDVVVVGEWVRRIGYFYPEITVSVEPVVCSSIFSVDPCYGRPKEDAYATITVTNTANYPIKDIIVEVDFMDYWLINETVDGSENLLSISNLAAAGDANGNDKITLKVPFTIPSDAKGKEEYNVEILSASTAVTDSSAEGYGHILGEADYTAVDDYYVMSLLTICNTLNGTSNPNAINQYRVKSSNFTTWMPENDNTCKSIYVAPGSYQIYQLDRQGYTLVSVEGAITSNNGTLVVESGVDYKVTFNNKVATNKWFRIWDKKENVFTIDVS